MELLFIRTSKGTRLYTELKGQNDNPIGVMVLLNSRKMFKMNIETFYDSTSTDLDEPLSR